MSNGIERGASFLDSAAETLRNGALVTFPPVAAATLSTRKASPPKPESFGLWRACLACR